MNLDGHKVLLMIGIFLLVIVFVWALYKMVDFLINGDLDDNQTQRETKKNMRKEIANLEKEVMDLKIRNEELSAMLRFIYGAMTENGKSKTWFTDEIYRTLQEYGKVVDVIRR